jgi:16S rRNA processing protein RimM
LRCCPFCFRNSNMKKNLVCIAKIASPHGVQGAVKIKTFTADPEAIAVYSPLYGKDGETTYKIKILSVKDDMVTVRIEGVNDRNSAAALCNKELFADKDLFPELEEDEFYYEDIIGMKVELEDGTPYGIVLSVDNYGGGDILEISCDGSGKVELFSFTKETFPFIDAEAGDITISPPEFEFVGDNDNG